MVRVYLSPRYNVGVNRTRNVLAQLVHFPGSFDEVVDVSRGFGICVCRTDQATHDAILVDGRTVPLSPLYADQAQFSAGLREAFDSLDMALQASIRSTLEAAGIGVAWISAASSLKDVLRHALRAVVVVQVLTGEHRAQVLAFLKGSLDLTIGQVQATVRAAVNDWMAGRGLAVDWIVSATTIRQVAHFIIESLDLGVLRLAGEEF